MCVCVCVCVQSPQLVARLKEIQAQQEEKEYKRMVKNVDQQVSSNWFVLPSEVIICVFCRHL